MFEIHEFSRLSQISVMMLQYYANAGILEPEGTDLRTGRRYYLAEQIEIAEKINILRDFGFSISEISVLRHDWNESNILREIERKRTAIEQEINERKQKIKAMEQYRDRMNGDSVMDIGPVILKDLPEYFIYSVRLTDHISRNEAMLWHRLKQCMGKEELSEQGTYMMLMDNSEHKDQLHDVELGVMVRADMKSSTEAVLRKLEPTQAICCRVMGGEEKVRSAYTAIAAWLNEHDSYIMSDFTRRIYKKNTQHSKGAEQKVTELQIPVFKKTQSV